MRYYTFLLLVVFLGCQSEAIVTNQDYKVGTKIFKWTDSERMDEYYGGNRLINVQIWYPVDSALQTNSFSPSQYYYEIDDVYKRLENWSEEDYQFVSEIPINSFLNCPISNTKSKFPTLIFSPGLGGNISQHTYYAEQLVKSGFVVVGVNHLYESEYVIDNENNVFPANIEFHDSLKRLDIPEQITAEKYREVKGERQRVLGEDLVFCLNKLIEINPTEFDNKLNMQKVGAWGHSIGGAAAVYASILDDRFHAILNIDGTPPSIALNNGINVPFMFIEDLTDYKNHQGYKKMHQRRSSFCQINSADSYRILIGDINHNSFLDIHYHMAKSREDKERALGILQQANQYMNQFFSQYLLDSELEFTEVQTDSIEIIKYLKH